MKGLKWAALAALAALAGQAQAQFAKIDTLMPQSGSFTALYSDYESMRSSIEGPGFQGYYDSRAGKGMFVWGCGKVTRTETLRYADAYTGQTYEDVRFTDEWGSTTLKSGKPAEQMAAGPDGSLTAIPVLWQQSSRSVRVTYSEPSGYAVDLHPLRRPEASGAGYARGDLYSGGEVTVLGDIARQSACLAFRWANEYGADMPQQALEQRGQVQGLFTRFDKKGLDYAYGRNAPYRIRSSIYMFDVYHANPESSSQDDIMVNTPWGEVPLAILLRSNYYRAAVEPFALETR